MYFLQILKTLLSDPLSAVAVMGIFGFFVAGSVSVWRGRRDAIGRLRQWQANFDAPLPNAAEKTIEPLIRGLAFVRSGAVATGQARWCSEVDAWKVIEANALALILGRVWWARLFVGAARHLTALALIATFLLIGIVLARDVPDALRPPVDGGTALASSNPALQHAVQLIGSKFLISAFGLLFSLIFHAVENRMETDVADEVHGFHRSHGARLTTREELQTEQVVRAVRALDAPLAHLAQIDEGSRKVQALLATAPDRTLAVVNPAVRAALSAELVAMVSHLTTRSSEEHSMLRAQLKLESAGAREAIASVRETIQKQAKSDLEALLEQLRQIVNTGYEEEAGKFRSAMTALTDAIPLIEQRLRQVVNDVDTALSRHTAEAAERETALAQKISHSYEDVAKQLDRATERAETFGATAELMLDEVLRLNKVHIEQLESELRKQAAHSIAHLATMGEDAAQQASQAVAKTTEARFKAVEKKLLEDTKAFAAGLSEKSKTFGHTAIEAIKQSAEALEASMAALILEAGSLRQGNEASAASLQAATEAMVAAAKPVSAAAADAQTLQPALGTTVGELGKVVAGLRDVTTRLNTIEIRAKEAQQKLVEEALPNAMARIADTLNSTTERYHGQLSELVERSARSNAEVSTRLAAEIERLAEVIDSYADDEDEDDSPAGTT